MDRKEKKKGTMTERIEKKTMEIGQTSPPPSKKKKKIQIFE